MMKRLKESLIGPISLITLCIIVMSAVMMQGFLVWQEQRILESRLREKATFINNFYSYWVADSLVHKDDVALQQIITRLEQDPEVVSILVIDNHKEVRYSVDSSKIGTVWEDPLVNNALQSGDGIASTTKGNNGKALILVSPLKTQGQSAPIGAVRIEFTFSSIQNQIYGSMMRFLQLLVGLLIAGVGLMILFFQKWVLYPLFVLKEMISSLNPLALEANFPETPDEFGQVHRAMNDFIIRIKADYQNQPLPGTEKAGQERLLTEEILKAFLPGTRLLLAGSNNQVVSDTGESSDAGTTVQAHLLDLITDKAFGALLSEAFQQEGSTMRGAVTFQDKLYQAIIWRIPSSQPTSIRTIIALEPTAQK